MRSSGQSPHDGIRVVYEKRKRELSAHRGHVGVTLMMGLISLWKEEDPPLCHLKTGQESGSLHARKRALIRHPARGHLDLGLPSLRHCCCLSSSVYSIVVAACLRQPSHLLQSNGQAAMPSHLTFHNSDFYFLQNLTQWFPRRNMSSWLSYPGSLQHICTHLALWLCHAYLYGTL